jgi:hypothetical protein
LISQRILLSSPVKFLIGLSMADKDTLLDGVEGLLRWLVPWFKSQLDSLVSGVKRLLHGLVPISRKKKRCSHCKRCTRAKAKDRVRRWRRQALPVALVVRCWRRSSKKAQHLAADISEPVHWKWKKKKDGLSSIIKPSLPLHLLVRFQSVNLVSWLGLDRDLPKLRKFSRILILREPLVV